MGTRRLVIWGAGGHALVVADIIRRVGWYDLVGFIDDVNPERVGTEFAHSVILGGREYLDIIQGTLDQYLILGFGDNLARLERATLVRAKGIPLGTAVHSRAIVADDVPIGAGSVIVAGAVVNAGASIGENVIINTGATVDHGCMIDNGVHIAPGAHLGGDVKVYRGALVGMGAIVVPGVTIDPGAIVGAGSLVLKDVPHSTTVYGAPAIAHRMPAWTAS